MKSKIKTYNSKAFREEYFNDNQKLNQLFERSIVDFFCLRIEDIMTGGIKPILPSREESHTLIYVTKGSYKTKIGFKEYTIKPNDVLIIQAGVVFSTEKINRNISGFTCHFHPDTLIGKFGNRAIISEFDFLHIGNHPIINIKDAKSAIQHLFERLALEFKGKKAPNLNIIHAYLYALLVELKILYGQNHPVTQNAAYRVTSQFRALAYKTVKENQQVADLAKAMNISPNHLNKSVKFITSKTASEIINEIKIIEIKYLLYQSSLTVSEIAYEMGYSDPSYFTRFFKKREGISPTDFRQMIEKS